MKKFLTLLLVSTFIFFNGTNCYAIPIAKEPQLTKENLVDLAKKYNLEFELIENPTEDIPATTMNTLEEVEQAIIKSRNQPAEIKMPDDYVIIPSSNNYEESNLLRAARYGNVASLIRSTEISRGLVVQYKVTGNFVYVRGGKSWVSVNNTSITESSTNGLKRLGTIRRNSATISSDSSKITQYHDYDIDHYITVPIPGLKTHVKYKSYSQKVTGNTHFYASSI